MSEYPQHEEPELKTLQIYVCVNCINRTPGTCHAPGCFYIYQNINEVPTYLEMYIVDQHIDSSTS
jgi:hypothetical protein